MAKKKAKIGRPKKVEVRKRQCRKFNRRSKRRCQYNAGPSGYCKRHEKELFPDGYNPDEVPEPPPPNIPDVPADFYRECYTDQELEGVDLTAMEAASLDAEIRLLRVQIRRVATKLKMQEEDPNWSELRDDHSLHEVSRDILMDAQGNPVQPAGGADGNQPVLRDATQKRRTSQRALDYYAIQEKLMARLTSFMRLRKELQLVGTGSSDPGEHARDIQKAQRAIQGLMHGKNLPDEDAED